VPPARTVADAADAFLARATAPTTRRSYAQTMRALTAAYGDRLLDALDGPAVAALAAHSWGALAPATWNRHVATLARSPCSAAAPAGCRSTCAPAWNGARKRTDRTKAVADTSLERLFRREDVPVREKCLWRLLYETAARAQEVLSLNVEDLDLDNKRARTVSKGGDTEWLHFQSGSARLLPRVIAGRQTGPLFLADRRPAPARTPAALDVCPGTGRRRLSYQRAEYLFKRHSRRISRNGLTLHQLRHSALTTLADANVSLPLLMGKSRHKNLRSLQRYVHPSAEAVAAMTAAHDPAARRRRF